MTQCLFTSIEFVGATLNWEMQFGRDHETRGRKECENPRILLKRPMAYDPVLVQLHALVCKYLVIEKKLDQLLKYIVLVLCFVLYRFRFPRVADDLSAQRGKCRKLNSIYGIVSV